MSLRWFGCLRYGAASLVPLKVGEPLCFKMLSTILGAVPEEQRHRLYRYDSVQGAQSNTPVYNLRKQSACYINVVRCFVLFFLLSHHQAAVKNVIHHRTGFRAADYYGLKKSIRVAAFIKKQVVPLVRNCGWPFVFVTVCIQIQNTYMSVRMCFHTRQLLQKSLLIGPYIKAVKM
jgi:hypothetical protein